MRSDHQDEEEYVLLDLGSVFLQLHIPPNAPYVLSVSFFRFKFLFFSFSVRCTFKTQTVCNAILSWNCLDFQGLDTMQPVAVIDDKCTLMSL